MKIRDIKDTAHEYKGFTLKGVSIRTAPRQVLGGRHWTDGGIQRNYQIWEGGRHIYKGSIYEKLSDAKEEVDSIIKTRTAQLENLKRFKDSGYTKERLLKEGCGFTARCINENYDNL